MRTGITLLFAVVFTLALNGQQQKAIDPVISAMHTISSHYLLEWVTIQCDDKYAGRFLFLTVVNMGNYEGNLINQPATSNFYPPTSSDGTDYVGRSPEPPLATVALAKVAAKAGSNWQP